MAQMRMLFVVLAAALFGCQVDFSKGFQRFHGNIPGNSSPEEEREELAGEIEEGYGENDPAGASVESDGGSRP